MPPALCPQLCQICRPAGRGTGSHQGHGHDGPRPGRQIQPSGHGNAIAPSIFGIEKGIIHCFKGNLRVVAGFQQADTKARGDRYGVALVLDDEAFDAGLEPGADRGGLLQRNIAEQDDELFAARASEPVIDPLEMVEIDHS